MTEQNLSPKALEAFVDALARFMVSHDLLECLREKGLLSEPERDDEQQSSESGDLRSSLV